MTTIPNYNSTMQEDLEGDVYLQMNETDMKNGSDLDEIELEERELEEDLEHLRINTDIDESLSERRSLGHFSRTHSNKKVFKSFQEKYPINMPHICDQVTLAENQRDAHCTSNTRLTCQQRPQNNNKKGYFSKQDLNKIYQELNLIHNKLVVG